MNGFERFHEKPGPSLLKDASRIDDGNTQFEHITRKKLPMRLLRFLFEVKPGDKTTLKLKIDTLRELYRKGQADADYYKLNGISKVEVEQALITYITWFKAGGQDHNKIDQYFAEARKQSDYKLLDFVSSKSTGNRLKK